jgi:hypothetical protein
MGAETILLRQEERCWGELTVKLNCNPQYSPVTNGWPAAVEGDVAWGATSFQSEDNFTLTLTDGEVSEVRIALEHFNSTGHSFSSRVNSNHGRSGALWR